MAEMRDLLSTYTDVAKSWVRRVVRGPIVNVLTEKKLNLEVLWLSQSLTGQIVVPVEKKGIFGGGVTRAEIEDRVMKIRVRVKGILDAMIEVAVTASA